MQFPSQSQLQQKLDEISDEFDAWIDETDGKFDIDTFFFEYFDGFEIEPISNKTRKMKFAFRMAKFFSPFAFKPDDKDHNTFWGYITTIGSEYLGHCSSEDIMLLREQHLDINAPEDIGYVLFRQEYNRPLESEFYNDETDALELAR